MGECHVAQRHCTGAACLRWGGAGRGQGSGSHAPRPPCPARNGWIKRGFNALLTRPPTSHSLSPFRSAATMRLHPGLGESTSV